MNKFMSKLFKVIFIGVAVLAAAIPGIAIAKSEIQKSKQAIEYFESELQFKTNPHGAKYVIDGKEKNVTIVDVRSEKDFAAGHIPGAVNVPWDKHKGFAGDETEFPQLRKDGYNYIYCYELLCNLSQRAAIKFASLGYPVKELVGGFEEWKNSKFPIEK